MPRRARPPVSRHSNRCWRGSPDCQPEVELELPASKVRVNSNIEYFDRLRESLRQFHAIARRRANTRHSANKRAYDQKLNEFHCDVGETVLLHRAVVPKGRYCKFLRPYRRAVILEKLGPVNYRVRLEGARRALTVHHNRLAKVSDD